MYKDLRKKAEKKVEAKMAFIICAIVFAFVSMILLMLSYYLPSISIWLMLPIPVFLMVLAILYFVAYGLPFVGEHSDDWQEREIEKEMLRLYRYKKNQLPPLDELSESEILELKEMESLRRKWDRDEDYV